MTPDASSTSPLDAQPDPSPSSRRPDLEVSEVTGSGVSERQRIALSLCCPTCLSGREQPCTADRTTRSPVVATHRTRLEKADLLTTFRPPPLDERLHYALIAAGFDETDAATATRVALEVVKPGERSPLSMDVEVFGRYARVERD